jgi:hypothetical protein
MSPADGICIRALVRIRNRSLEDASTSHVRIDIDVLHWSKMVLWCDNAR